MELISRSVHNRLTYVFDLDGVIYRGIEPQPHARDTILALRSRGDVVRFYTNNSGLSRQAYSIKLTGMGIPTPIDEIFTSSYAAALYFLEQNAVGKTVYKIGEQGINEELEAIGMRVISDMEDLDAEIDYVVVGIDRQFDYQKLTRAMAAIMKGAGFIATNGDVRFPIESGDEVPGNGALVAAVQTATAAIPFMIGKPETYAINKVLELTDTPPERSVMVGDNLATDITGGNRAGMQSVLVLTGITKRDEAEKAQGEMKPDRIIETLAELL